MTLSLSEQLHALDIAHSPAMPLAHMTTHMTPGASARHVLARMLDASSSTRAPLWVGPADTLPVWRAQVEFATPLSVASHMRMQALMYHLIEQRVEVADVVEGVDMPKGEPTSLQRHPPTHAFLSGHAHLLEASDFTKDSILNHTDLLLAESPDAHPESLLPMLDFGGTDQCPAPEEHIAVLAYWQALWGARLIACTPTRLEVQVLRRPESWRDAFELAQEHIDYCPPLLVQGPQALRARAAMCRDQNLWCFDWS